MTLATRRALNAIYEPKEAEAPDQRAQAAMKKIAMDEFRARYAALRAGWAGPRQGAYDGWVARANNAMFGAQGAYDDQVPNFEALFVQQVRDWPRFYAAVKRLAALPKPQRTAALEALVPAGAPPAAAAMIEPLNVDPATTHRQEHGDRGA